MRDSSGYSNPGSFDRRLNIAVLAMNIFDLVFGNYEALFFLFLSQTDHRILSRFIEISFPQILKYLT